MKIRRWKKAAAGILAAALFVTMPAGAFASYAGPLDELLQQGEDAFDELVVTPGSPLPGTPSGPMDELGQVLQEMLGPSGDAGAVSSGPGGPGTAGPVTGGSNVTSSVQAPAMDAANYYNQSYASRIVTAVDKYSYDYMVHDLQVMQERFRDRIQVNTIAQTADGRSIYHAVIGNTHAPKKILIQAAIHGREYIVVPLVMQQMEMLLQGAAAGGTYNGQPVSELLDRVCIHFVPMANPDGVSISQFGEAGIRSAQLLELARTAYQMDVANNRTSLDYAPYLATWKANAHGVDLNHNFDADWTGLTDAGYARGIGFKGTSILSEPESRALANLCQENSYSAVISYHTMGNVIYWDTKNNRAAQKSLDIANLVNSVTGYSIQPSLGIGGLKDWLQKRSSPIPGVTIEVGKTQSPVDFAEYGTIWEQNKMIPALIASYVK